MATATKAPVTPALSVPVTPIPNAFGMIVNVDGYLAVYIGDRLSDNKPARELQFRRSDVKVDEWNTDFLGGVLTGQPRAYLFVKGREIQFPDWHEWTPFIVEQAIPKPRDGKEYGWEWNPDKARYSTSKYAQWGWYRVDYPRCSNCHETSYSNGKGGSTRWTPYHSPEITPAGCGWCHKGGTCDGKGVCAPYDSR